MPGLTLLNIDREKSYSKNPIEDVRESIIEIQSFISKLSPDSPKVRLVPLRNRLKQLQDSVSQFGSAGDISVQEKQMSIMDLHPDLMMLTNDLTMFGPEFSVYSSISMNFLLNHLCSTAASDPKSRVIGVSNVMAQVLSNQMTIIELPDFTLDPEDPNYFDEFSKIFNSMLTTAGLFAAPVLSLPDIPMSALGGWADQALEQFSIVNQFVEKYFRTEVFYLIDKRANATPFDTTTDILSFYVYENEFLAALIARADLLSGLEFKITEDGQPINLSSTEDITQLLANAIDRNCDQIQRHLDHIEVMYQEGRIDRNEKPSNHPHLMDYISEAKIWKQIAKAAILLVEIFSEKKKGTFSGKTRVIKNVDTIIYNSPPLDSETNDLQKQLLSCILALEADLFEMFPDAINNIDNFIQSSDFTKFKDFLTYIVILTAANDILLESNSLWIHWLLKKYSPFLVGDAVKYNPYGTLEVAMLSMMVGLISQDKSMMTESIIHIKDVRPYLEFQMHHLLTIETILALVESPSATYLSPSMKIPEIIQKFLQDFEIQHNSQLYQRANLYLAMLSMYQESPEHEFLRQTNERYVAFDLFSWLLVPKNFKPDFPYMPLNTSLDNLSSG